MEWLPVCVLGLSVCVCVVFLEWLPVCVLGLYSRCVCVNYLCWSCYVFGGLVLCANISFDVEVAERERHDCSISTGANM